jgi:hypothetical protein
VVVRKRKPKASKLRDIQKSRQSFLLDPPAVGGQSAEHHGVSGATAGT